MTCAHRLEPLAVKPFLIRKGAAWLMDYCAKCGERHWHVRNPLANTPITEEQPRP